MRSMFKRYRGWTVIPLWMHEAISLNAHLSGKKMPTLIRAVLAAAEKEGRKAPYTADEFIRGWIKYCVVVPPDYGATGPSCVKRATHGGVFVEMREDVQRAFFASRRIMLIGKVRTMRSGDPS